MPPPAADAQPFRIIERSDPEWASAWTGLVAQLLHLPTDHPLSGRTIDDFMLMGASGPQCHFKDICTRMYLQVSIPLST